MAKHRRLEPASIIVAAATVTIAGMTLWYLIWPTPLVIQGEADATRIDIAARVDGRVGQRPVSRGQNVKAGEVLVKIDNPKLVADLKQAVAAKDVQAAELARILAGTRSEIIEQRKAAAASASANLTLAQQTYDRTKQLSDHAYASLQRLDEVTNSLRVAQRSVDQANLASDEAVAGYTPEERNVAKANVANAEASIATLQAQADEMVITAPIDSQVYQIGAELGEYISPGIPLLSLVDLNDVWIRFDLREDLVKGLKEGDRFQLRIPALDNRLVTAEIRLIASKGEYAGWRATRATGDFDLRTFQVRAYPVEALPELRPGMSVYADWMRGPK
jgi:HlyD family secretion protein